MHYVIGDVHGCFDQMIKLIDQIEAQDADAQFIFVGDFVDRGPKVVETINWAMEHITENGKYQSVIGNHEFMLLQWYHKFTIWMANGCDPSRIPLTSYDFLETASDAGILDYEHLEPIMEFFLKLPFRKEIIINGIKFIIVHAWEDENETDEKKRCDNNLWERNCTGNYATASIIVHGHTPTFNVDYCEGDETPNGTSIGMIGYRRNAINVDGGRVFQGKILPLTPKMLCGICLETLEEFYAETLEENLLAGRNMSEDMLKLYVDTYIKDFRNKHNQWREEMLGRIRG